MNLRRKLQQYIALNSYVEKYTNILPAGYERLEYIESTGTQYIDTGLTVGSNTRILAQYKYNDTFTSPFLVRDENTAAAGFGIGVNNSQQFISDYNSDRKVFTTITPNTTDIITVDKNKNVCTITIGGQSETVTNTASTFTTTNTLPFFAIKNVSTVTAGKFTFYSFKIYNDNTLVRDFIPAKNSSGVIGMYDTVSGTFLTNAGTGDFVAGPSTTDFKDAIHNGLKEITAYGKAIQPAKDYLDTVTANGGTELVSDTLLDTVTAKGKTQLRKVPIDYEELEYVTFDGTQIVDTGIICNEESKIESKWMANSSSVWVYGTGADNPRITCYCVSSGNERFGNVTVDSTGITHGVLNTVIHDKNGFYYNGTNGKPYSNVGTFTCLDTLTIGNSNGSTGTPYFTGNFYYMRIYQNNKLALNLVPAKRKSDNIIGFYDTVSNSFIVSSTGTLIAGPGVDAPTTYIRLKYLESNGQQYIDTGIKPNQNTEITTIVQGLATTGQRFFSVCNGTPSSPTTPYYAVGFSNSGMFVNQYGTSNNVLSKAADTDKHTIVKKDVLIVDGVNINTAVAETFQQDYSIYLFGANYGGNTTLLSSLRMFTFTVRENGIILQNLIPVKRCSDGVLGMYDTISGDFLLNGGSADFIAGPEIGGDPNNPYDIYCNNGKLVKTANEANYITSNVTLGYWIKNSTGIPEASEQNFYTNMMPVKPDTSYVCYGRNKSDGTLSKYNRIAWYDASGTWISNSTYTVDTIGIATSPANAAYARFHCNPLNSGTVTQETIDSFNWTFCEGTEEVAYVPFLQIVGTKELLLDSKGNLAAIEDLFKLTSNVQDTQELVSGVITHKTMAIILTGAEEWGAMSNDRGYYTMRSDLAGVIYTENTKGISSHFPYAYWYPQSTDNLMPINRFTFNRSSDGTCNGNISFRPDTTVIDTVDKWKAWLTAQYFAGTPVIVVYPLNTATTETVSSQYLQKSPVTVTQSSLDNLEVTSTESLHTVPTPNYPLDIRCNNGLVLYSKNLFDKNNYEEMDGYVDGNTGVLTVASGSSNIQKCVVINVKPNTRYQISGILNSNYGTFQTKTIGSVATTYATGNTILTTGPNDKYIIGLVRTTNGTYNYLDTLDIYEINSNGQRISVSGIQETLQDSADIVNTATCEALFSIGTYKDTQEILTGLVTRNLGVWVLTGAEEGWSYYDVQKIFYCNTLKFKRDNNFVSFCTHYKGMDYSQITDLTLNNVVFTSYVSATEGVFAFRDSRFNNTTMADWKQWLADQYAAGTPVIIVYPLATATTESVPTQTLVISPVSIKQASMSDLTVDTTQTSVTVPTPARPLDIYCNNGKLKSGIADGYTELEYIESSGTQYINTGIKPNYLTGIELNFTPTNNNEVAFGCRWSGSPEYDTFGNVLSGVSHGLTTYFGRYSSQLYSNDTSKTYYKDTNMSIKFFGNELNINTNNYTVERQNIGFDNNPNEIYLFALNNNGTPSTLGSARLFYVRYYDNDRIIFNGIPAKRNSDNELGIYDTVSNRFLTNTGTGTFTAGGPIVSGNVYASGNPETITIHSKNLFNKNGDLKTGTYRVDNGVWVDNDQFRTLDYIPGKPGVSYTLSAQSTSETGGNAFSVQAWDSTHTNWLGTVASSTAQSTQYASGISPAGTAYLSVSFAPSYRDINTLQLEEGYRPTVYEPYGNTVLYTKDLLGINNYQDSQDIINGIITRKIGVKVFDGTENWKNISDYYNISKTDIGSDSTVLPAASINIICTHYETISGVPNRTSVNIGGSYVNFRDDNISTLADWTQYLADQYAAGTPVIVLYPIATDITENVGPQFVELTAGNSYITKESEYVESNLSVKYKKLK